jgi:hypothetical protein
MASKTEPGLQIIWPLKTPRDRGVFNLLVLAKLFMGCILKENKEECMPYEVYPVQCLETETRGEERSSRNPDKAARELKDIYTEVAKMGGEIIAEHTIVHPGDKSYGLGERPWLFLVAKLPDASESKTSVQL